MKQVQANIVDSTRTGPAGPDSSVAANKPRRWRALAATSFGLFMALLDVTIVNVALPTIGRDLSALDAGVRFLPLSGLILVVGPLAGAFSDRLGSKAIMVVGLATLIVAVLLMARISPTNTQSDWLVLPPAFILGGLEPVSDSISKPGQGALYGDIAQKTELGRCEQNRVSPHSMNGLQ